MSSPENVLFACQCEEPMRRACKGESFFGEHEGKRYCVFHFPGGDKRQAFDAAFEKKLSSKDFNYHGVWFPEGGWFSGLTIPEPAYFTSATFAGGASFRKTVFKTYAHFDHATFTGPATFRYADFDSAVFEGPAYFEHATFDSNAQFDYATFESEVDFKNASFAERAGFRRVKFKAHVDFWRCTFRERVDFDEAVFSAYANFSPVRFGSVAWFRAAQFAGASFGGSRFGDEAVFSGCRFGAVSFGAEFSKKADFRSARFDDIAYFSWAKFDTQAHFRLATFWSDALFGSATFTGETDFWSATFKDGVVFSAEHGKGGFSERASCDFQHARFERPERVSFHTLTLRPHWFLNVDPRKFEFVAVRWSGILSRDLIDSEIGELRRKDGQRRKEELSRKAEAKRNAERFGDEWEKDELETDEAEDAQTSKVADERKASFHHLMSIACRQLAANAEENHRYDEASDFRFWSMELRRKEGWRARQRLSVSILHTLYRYLSGYGENIGTALGWLIAIWLFFAIIYTQVGFVQPVPPSAAEPGTNTVQEVSQLERCREALAYSLAVMILQKPEPRPRTTTAKFAVLAETIFGPILAALFALAVRRRFMR